MFTSKLVFWLASIIALPLYAQESKPGNASLPKIYTVVEEHPRFPGKNNALIKYLENNMRYPETARKERQQGTVFVNFIVTEKGEIVDVKVVKSLSAELDAEALRLIQSMPTWIPGKQSGMQVACRYSVPVHFSLR